MMRVGQGLDVHAFSDDADRPLILGGVMIPDGPGLAGHSDADVVLHALTDAVLGAAALGDLGTLFGTDDPRYAGAPSSVFLNEALRRAGHAGWRLANADCTITAQRPRLAVHRIAIADGVNRLMGVEPGTVSVKSTSTDALGAVGRGEGIACLAVVLLQRADAAAGRGEPIA
jgi:2-C-methyl-D-erythritol 2,4-cyclodiphosphate synthase